MDYSATFEQPPPQIFSNIQISQEKCPRYHTLSKVCFVTLIFNVSQQYNLLMKGSLPVSFQRNFSFFTYLLEYVYSSSISSITIHMKAFSFYFELIKLDFFIAAKKGNRI